MNRIDLTPGNATKLIPPITFFNHLEEVSLSEEDIKILEQITRLSSLIPINPGISAKILKIRILRRIHLNLGLKFAKDIVEYLDSIFLANSENKG